MITRSLFAAATCCLIVVLATAQDPAPAKNQAPELKTNKEKASYLIGFNIGNDLKQQGLDVDVKTLASGIAAALAGNPRGISDEEAQMVFRELQAELAKKSAAKAAKNLEDGRKFLEANKEKEGVKVTKSGLQYIVIKEGDGAVPTTDSTVSTHYRGTLIDGTMFDSSYAGEAPVAGEEPVSFGVTQVIKGWTEALQLMKVGSKYRLFIPSELAYGEQGPASIGPNSVLIFDIELISAE